MIDVLALIKKAEIAAQAIQLLTGTISESREAIARHSPKDLAEFDARVASARKPSQQAADAGAAENATSTKEDLTNGDT